MKNDRYSGKIKLEFFGKVQEYFKIYRDNKQELDHRIIDNNRWYKSRYNSDPDKSREDRQARQACTRSGAAYGRQS